MSEKIHFELDGRTVEAEPGETIWAVAHREGVEIPHLCHRPEPGYRPDGNCRACMVEVEGERVLAASCIRKPTEGMKVKSASERAKKSREMVFELLLADQPAKTQAHDPDSTFWHWTGNIGLEDSRFPKREQPAPDVSHPAMAVNLDACIHCNLCVRACREVQVNDVIGMAYRGHDSKVIFDFDDPMGESTCVACGECVQACPTGALMSASLLDDNQVRTEWPDYSVDSVCPYCGVGCQVTYNVKDDRILSVDGRNGPSNEQRLCVKGRYGNDYSRHPHRLTKPLIRREDAPKSGDIQIDSANPWTHFREATWEEAMEKAASGLKAIRDMHGGGALSGFGSAKGTNEEAYLFQKLVRVGFGTNNVDHCTRLCHASSVAALMENIGSGAVTAPFSAALDAECVIVIGARPSENHPVAASYMKQAAKNGTKLIVMDPRFNQQLGRYAYKNLQFNPGTDVAMLSAMLHVIFDEGLEDTQYIQAHADGVEELREKVKEFPPEKMAGICGIDAETLRDVARTYAKSRASIIFWGMGVSQHVHGTDNNRSLINLALSTGHIGRPGTGLHPLRGQNNVQGASDAGLIPMVYPDYQPVTNADFQKKYEQFWGTKLDGQAGLTVVEIINAIHDGKIKGMYIMGENPAMSDPDQRHAREALAMLDHLVVQEIFLTETAWHADVILPASAQHEKSGTYTNTNRQIQMGRPALKLPGEARQDWEIIQDLARRIGLNWQYTYPGDVFNEMAQVMPSLKNISWERLDREDCVTYPCDAPDKPGNEILFGEGFPTESGRGGMRAVDLVPPDEVPDDEYPMILTTGRQLEHWHTGAMTRRASILDSLEPEAVASMNPRELKLRGWNPGDRVRVSTRRGEVELTVRGDRDVPANVVFIPFCYAEAAANVLTNPQLDPYGKIPEFKFCAAKVEAVQEQVAAE
ncbi:formate dehydrogenase subunit alpha [Ferruginivarius sediminum]|uniref:Formate dehydrogenase subunit alpha n=1 Tax=Ferruginivarius sediminum TaxID=2661937 RepID=A0A369T6D4_9PROT|nr:formate dehydrogenase subunit alpha [Ferruginivarius sediminum]RDD60880.1 formate dehydrogenase subunit alpha [Ferruginivarius sediminum]